jgi:hypothetical protein
MELTINVNVLKTESDYGNSFDMVFNASSGEEFVSPKLTKSNEAGAQTVIMKEFYKFMVELQRKYKGDIEKVDLVIDFPTLSLSDGAKSFFIGEHKDSAIFNH